MFFRAGRGRMWFWSTCPDQTGHQDKGEQGDARAQGDLTLGLPVVGFTDRTVGYRHQEQ